MRDKESSSSPDQMFPPGEPPAAAQPATDLMEVLQRAADFDDVLGRVQMYGAADRVRDSWDKLKNAILYANKRLHPPASVVSPIQPEWIEHRLRQEWWTGHGCSFASLYGDDGEMQCNAMTCRKDFKRDSMESLRQHVEARRLAAYADSQSSAVSPREEPK